MGKIVVADLFRLGKNGDKYDENLKVPLRTNVKIDSDHIKSFNAQKSTSGQMYVVKEKETKERDEQINPVKRVRPAKSEDANK